MMLRPTLVAAVVYACTVFGHLAADVTPVTLDVAVRTGLVEVEVNGRGACTGDAVRVDVRRKVSRQVRVIVEPGTVLQNTGGKVQSMVCHGVKYERTGNKYRRVDVMVLNSDQRRSFVVEAYCRDFHKPTPSTTCAFQIAAVDAAAARVIVHGKAADAELKAIQTAIWLQSGVSEGDLRSRFRATDAQLKTAHILVQAATKTEQQKPGRDGSVESTVQVLVHDWLAELKKRRQDIEYVRGDTVEVTADDAPVQIGRRTAGAAGKGAKYEVLAVDRDGVAIEFAPEPDAKPRRGWISHQHVKLADGAPRGEGRPLLRRLGELVSEVDLEVITAADRGL